MNSLPAQLLVVMTATCAITTGSLVPTPAGCLHYQHQRTAFDTLDNWGKKWGNGRSFRKRMESSDASFRWDSAGANSTCACAFVVAHAPYRVPDGVSWGWKGWTDVVPLRLTGLDDFVGGRLLEIGANVGDDASSLLQTLRPNFAVLYEPLPELVSALRRRFEPSVESGTVVVVHAGVARDRGGLDLPDLGSSNTSLAASAYSLGADAKIRVPTVTVRDALDAAAGRPGGEVDVLSMNCEGCEFDVLEDLLGIVPGGDSSGEISRVKLLQFGSHRMEGILQPVGRYCAIREALGETHTQLWGEPWMWERWRRRGA